MLRPFNRPVREKAPPASSCFRCYRDGVLTENQAFQGGANRLATLRFECPHCRHEWTTNRDEALAHGAFLRRIDPGQRNDQ